MRLHRLRLTAFGPFPGTEELDLDEMAAGGLFLLHGATGAGKSSILDAVCFALYGRLPGARAGTTRIRSDHAAPDIPPEVQCELTAGGRRLEVTRSPAWERPRRRGSGTTGVPARVLVREHVDGAWVPRTSRADEAAQLLDDALGMGADQFTSVVLLPQGEFAAFLRARAEERRPMLQRLFDTGRYAAVEAGLAERARGLGERVARADASLDRLLARAHEAAAALMSAVPPAGTATAQGEGDGSELIPAAEDDPVGHVGALRERARAEATAARAEHRAARASLVRHRERHDAHREVADLLQQHADAAARAARLAGDADRVAVLERRLAAARAAEGLRGHLEALNHADRQVAEAGTRQARAEARAARLRAPAGQEPNGGATGPSPAAPGPDPAALRDEAGRLGAMLDDEAEMQRLRRVALEADARVGAARDAEDDATRRAAQARTREAAGRARLEELAVVAAGLTAAAASERRAALVAAAAADLPARERAAAAAADRERAAVDAEQAAREAWLDVRERRIAGAAAELAAGLSDGSPCPVCGSADHPRPAPPAPGAASAAAEQAARSEHDRAADARAAAQVQAQRARERWAEVRARAEGLSPRQAATAREAAAAALARARSAAAALDDARAEVSGACRAVVAADAEIGAAGAAAAAATTERDTARAGAAAIDRRLAAARGADADLRERRDRLTALAGALEELEAAAAAAAGARAAADRVRAAAGAAAEQAGLPGLAAAAEALLPADEVRALAEGLRRHQDALAAATASRQECAQRLAERRAALGDPAAALTDEGAGAEALAATAAALAASADALAAAEARAEAAARRCAVAEAAVAALDDLHAHVAADVAAAAPLRAEHTAVADLAACAAGSGGGNALRMPLPSFVLAARLEQVAAAATVRLQRVSGGRYALRHSDSAERNRRKSGLGLVVSDAWTGVDRDPATLSGGEAFMASLALALGLADVVQAECGGGAIETLFVDEGFGSLDEESLEEVLEVLDGLREGGRAVGVVSHVPELRTRVPAGVEVLKTPAGSSLRVRCGAA